MPQRYIKNNENNPPLIRGASVKSPFEKGGYRGIFR
jgi:hypothetical protein